MNESKVLFFTESEACTLNLDERLSADRARQKTIRAKIRRLGFFISDYWPGFSSRDFDELVRTGKIKVVERRDEQNVASPAARLQPAERKIACAEKKNDVAGPKKPYSGIKAAREKYRPADIRCLLIGESPPPSVDRFF